MEIRTVRGLLVQDRDQKRINPKHFEVVTKRQPTDLEFRSMLFGWRVVHVKSNAIVYAVTKRLLEWEPDRCHEWTVPGLPYGRQEKRVYSGWFNDCFGCFFPFADGLLAAADAGATAAIQPGGSVRDDEVIAAARA